MTYPQYSAGLAVTTVLAWIGWLLALIYVNPTTTGTAGVALFLVALWLALIGTFSFFGLFIRRRRFPQEILSRAVFLSYIQGNVLAAIVIITLLLVHWINL